MAREPGGLDIVALLRADVESLPPKARPACLAALERRAAERYRGWAAESTDPALAAGLRVCAARETAIADMIEAVFPAPSESSAALRETLDRIGPKLSGRFTESGAAAKFAVQAAAERAGAVSWGLFADLAANGAERWTLEICARLEAESADFLDAAISRPREDGAARGP